MNLKEILGEGLDMEVKENKEKILNRVFIKKED